MVSSFKERSTYFNSNSAYLVAIDTESTLSFLRQLGVYTKASQVNMAGRTYKQESVIVYAYAKTNFPRLSV